MTQYNTLNVKLSNSQLNKLKSSIKNETKITSNLSLYLIENTNDKTNFSHKLVLTNMQVSEIVKLFRMAHQLIQNFQKFNCLK